jgi:predicted HTH domain antitoxin
MKFIKCDRVRLLASESETERSCVVQAWWQHSILDWIGKKLKIVVLEREIAMSIVVSDEILSATRMSEAEMRSEIALMLFEKEKLTLAQASRFAGINRIAFQHLLASRQIPVHYGVEDFEQDIKNLREMGRLRSLSAIRRLSIRRQRASNSIYYNSVKRLVSEDDS